MAISVQIVHTSSKYIFLNSQHYLQCPRVKYFGIIVLDSKKSKTIDLCCYYTENKLQVFAFAAITAVCISLQHCNLA